MKGVKQGLLRGVFWCNFMHACDKGFFQSWMWLLMSLELILLLGMAGLCLLYSLMEGAGLIVSGLRLGLMP